MLAGEPYDGKLSRTVLTGGKLERAYLSNQRLKPYHFLNASFIAVSFFLKEKSLKAIYTFVFLKAKDIFSLFILIFFETL